MHARAVCGDIQLYGAFLQALGFCNPDTDLLVAHGAVLLERHGVEAPPEGVGAVAFEVGDGEIRALLGNGTLRADEHRLGILLVDPATGQPLPADYGPRTEQQADATGVLTGATLTADLAALPDEVRTWLLVDATPVQRTTLAVR